MFKIRKDDLVQVIKGKDRGKKGKVLSILVPGKRALVEGINLAKKHMRKRKETDQAGIVSIEAPISLANLMLICKNCGHAARIGFKVLNDGTKSRFCRQCQGII